MRERMSGIIPVNKPTGMTSHDVVSAVRRALGTRRVGHSGTLDPMASGVLPVCVGRATRAVEFLQVGEKEYIARFRTGLMTDTGDITGNITGTCRGVETSLEIEAVLRLFHGPITQVPPMYSALKRDGKRLYQLAREGVTVEREPRPAHIHELCLLGGRDGEYEILVRCSKGTYIRTLCEDIARAAGSAAVMTSLVRTESGGFRIESAVCVDALREMAARGEVDKLLYGVDMPFEKYPVAVLNEADEKKVKNGALLSSEAYDAEGLFRAYSASGEFLALCEAHGGEIKTVKSFFETD